jgi:hypothetical protein
MKKRKLTEEERKAVVRRGLEQISKDILYMGKIAPNRGDPRAVAKYLAHELFECFPIGTDTLARLIKSRTKVYGVTIPEKERRFLGKMLIALGEYVLKGQPVFDSVDVDAAKIKKVQPHLTVTEIVSKLEELHPNNFTREALEKRVRRLLKFIPPGYLDFPPL